MSLSIDSVGIEERPTIGLTLDMETKVANRVIAAGLIEQQDIAEYLEAIRIHDEEKLVREHHDLVSKYTSPEMIRKFQSLRLRVNGFDIVVVPSKLKKLRSLL